MPKLPAYDGTTLALDGNAVRLRPSLRAAFQLPESPEDMRIPVLNLHLGTIREIITTAATDQQDAIAFLAKIDTTPLQIVADAIIAPLVVFLGSFTPPDDGTDQPSRSGDPMAWPDVVRLLYRRATGWLHWTPEVAWNATPTEISEAFAGWLEYIEATTPRLPGEDDGKPTDPEQAARNVAAGLDPEFDRVGLRALKRRIASGQ